MEHCFEILSSPRRLGILTAGVRGVPCATMSPSLDWDCAAWAPLLTPGGSLGDADGDLAIPEGWPLCDAARGFAAFEDSLGDCPVPAGSKEPRPAVQGRGGLPAGD
jgi:hypothetical protein